MRTYLTLFIISTVSALLLTPPVRRKAREWGAVAIPDDGRHIHAAPTPRLGGIAIYLAFLLTLALVPFTGNLVSEIFTQNLPRIVSLLIPATLIFLFGIYDDFRSASAPVKIFFQTIAATLLFTSGLRIENLSSPFGGYWRLPLLVSFALTALWVILITNAFNLIDGIDGLAAGASIFALLSILIFSIAQGNPEISLLSITLLGAVFGFLRYNFNPATIFLGDSGSLFLGFMAAALSLAGSQKGSTIVAIAIPLVSFGLPITEAGLSLIRRFLSGAPLLAGDRGHIHHRLLDRGLSQRQAAIILYGVCGLFSLFGLMLLNPQRNIGALVFFILGVGLILGVQHLRYPEFAELGQQIRRSLHRRRRTLANNVRLHRVGEADSADELRKVLAQLDLPNDPNDFDAILIRLPTGQTLWSWQRQPNEQDWLESTEQSTAWQLTIPLLGGDQVLRGQISFWRDMRRVRTEIDHGSFAETLAREISNALERMARKEPS
ncbi:MAG: glycosyltransferase family 4 protein [Acidobacteriota bacterium]